MLLVEVAVILILIAVNGLFSGAEIAIVATRRTRVQELSDEGRGSARAVLALKDDPERFLATVQIGITVVGATAAAIGGASLAADLTPLFVQLDYAAEHAEAIALAVVVASVSYLSIVVGELVPKSLALRAAERYALLIGKPLLALSWLSQPLVWILSSSANLLLKPFGDRTTFTETRHSAEELQQLVGEAAKAGTIHPQAGEIASRALELPELTAADVMVPRQDVVMLPLRAPLEELRRILLEHTHSRLPVYDGRVDNVVGYVNVKDLLALVWERKLLILQDLMRPPYFVPETKRAVELLTEMRASHTPFAIVVDEHGGMSGIVTMEDVLEELVGEIFSEHTTHVEQLIAEQADGSAIVSGAAPVRDVNRALGLELPDEGTWTTVAGLCLAMFGRMPRPGETLDTEDGSRLEIVDASPRRIRSVRIYRRRDSSAGDERRPPDSA